LEPNPSYKSEVDAYMGLVATTEDQFALRKRVKEQDKVIAELTAKMEEFKDQLTMKNQHLDSQKQLIDGLETRVKELEKSNADLLKERTEVAVNEQKCQRDLLVTLSDQTEALLQGLGLVDAQSHHLADMILQEIRGGPKGPRISPARPRPKPKPPATHQPAAAAPRVEPAHRASPPSKERVPPPAVPSPEILVESSEPIAPVGSSPKPAPKRRAPSDAGSTQPRKAQPGGPRGKAPATIEPEVPIVQIPDGTFITGDWLGSLSQTGVLPQDLTEEQYLSGGNVVF
jgi:hypothetical protein